MPELEMETAPRFEDAFIDLLGSARRLKSAGHHSPGGRSPDETVIEAVTSHQNSAILPH